MISTARTMLNKLDHGVVRLRVLRSRTPSRRPTELSGSPIPAMVRSISDCRCCYFFHNPPLTDPRLTTTEDDVLEDGSSLVAANPLLELNF